MREVKLSKLSDGLLVGIAILSGVLSGIALWTIVITGVTYWCLAVLILSLLLGPYALGVLVYDTFSYSFDDYLGIFLLWVAVSLVIVMFAVMIVATFFMT